MLVHMYTPVRKQRAGYLLPESYKAAEGHKAIASLEAELPCLQLPARGRLTQRAGAGEQWGVCCCTVPCPNADPHPHKQLAAGRLQVWEVGLVCVTEHCRFMCACTGRKRREITFFVPRGSQNCFIRCCINFSVTKAEQRWNSTSWWRAMGNGKH